MGQDLVQFVNKSPEAVAVHDKHGWKSIFAQYHIVEDPVGSQPHFGGLYDPVTGERGDGPLDRFYDTFIAPNKIVFDVSQDIVCGQHVVRDLTVHIEMSDSLSASVPMHLLYELIEEKSGQWKIKRLAAHWELMPMMSQIFGKGLACVPVLFGLTLRMLKYQKLSGILGFCKAAFTIGDEGKKQVDDFVAALNNHSKKKLEALFCDFSAHDSFYIGDQATPLSDWLTQEVKIQKFDKALASGNFVTTNILFQINNENKSAVAFFEFNKKTKKIRSLKLYL